MKDELKELRIVDNFYQTSLFFPMPTVIISTLCEDGTTNLIMERNIYYDKDNDVGIVATSSTDSDIAWTSDDANGGNHYGPVAAMTYLHNATKDWYNIPNMIMNYEDENINYSTQQKGTTGFYSKILE